ncbi:MAG: site-2 protease family protein [Elusimicrobiaceae bacterium]|nr:site-2 protease family protein [Elusimicrobiaceae bacterium]
MQTESFFVQLPVLIFSIVCHEYAHGYIAARRGDDTAGLMGRLTLNPLPHVDPIGTIIVPVIAFFSSIPAIGWAKPVPVNPLRLESPRRDMMWVSLAGPLTNFALAGLFALFFKLTLVAVGMLGMALTSGSLAVLILKSAYYGVLINLVLAFFNLIPLAPLDGSHILAAKLSGGALEKYARINQYGPWILIGLLFTHGLDLILRVPIALAMWVFSALRIFSP